jgi:hypothetical protein
MPETEPPRFRPALARLLGVPVDRVTGYWTRYGAGPWVLAAWWMPRPGAPWQAVPENAAVVLKQLAAGAFAGE